MLSAVESKLMAGLTAATARVLATGQASVKPPRLTFAGYCIYCNTQWCRSERCKTLHQGTRWGVCDDCHGLSIIQDSDGVGSACFCYFGLMEVAR